MLKRGKTLFNLLAETFKKNLIEHITEAYQSEFSYSFRIFNFWYLSNKCMIER